MKFNPISGQFDDVGTGGSSGVTSVNGDSGPAVTLDAIDIPYDNTGSGLTATEVQAAIDEVNANIPVTTDFLKKDGTVAITGTLVPDSAGGQNLGTQALPFNVIYGLRLKGNTNNNTVLDIDNRRLNDSAGTAAFDWATPGILNANSNNITEVSTVKAPVTFGDAKIEFDSAGGVSIYASTGPGPLDPGSMYSVGASNYIEATNDIVLTSVSGTFFSGPVIDAGNALIKNVGTPVDPNDAATKDYVDNIPTGITWATPVDASIIPDTNNTYEVGSSTNGFSTFWGNAIRSVGGADLTVEPSSNYVLPMTTEQYHLGAPTQRWLEVASTQIRTDSVLSDNALTIEADTGAITIYTQAEQVQLKSFGGSFAPALQFFDKDGTNYVSIKAPNSLTGPYDLVLPADDGTFGEVLTTDGSGVLSWSAPSLPINKKEQFTLSAGDITNGYIDLTQVAMTDSIDFVFNGLVSTEGTDYTVSYTGGAGGKTRIDFSTHTPALVATNVVNVKYQY